MLNTLSYTQAAMSREARARIWSLTLQLLSQKEKNCSQAHDLSTSLLQSSEYLPAALSGNISSQCAQYDIRTHTDTAQKAATIYSLK